MTYGKSINFALDEKLKSDPRVILLGEDICDPYGGAFKITKGLSTKYPDRVINTPISEHALTGVAAGAALGGMRPVLEIMFGDFITLCADQLINHASKFSWMYNNKVSVPMVIRTPMGGRRGYGPTHSQTLEKLYLGIPGIKIIAPSHFHNVGNLLKVSIEDNNPVLFIENKMLYPRRLEQLIEGYIGEFATRVNDENYYTITLSNYDFDKADVTVITYGGMLPILIDATQELLVEHEIASEIVVPSSIKPIDITPMKDSIEKTGRCVVVEEGTLTNGWGAEVSALIQEEFFSILRSPIKRVAAKDSPIGASRPLENSILPQKEDIISSILEVIR